MIAKKKEFYGGFVMLAGFFIVLAIMFMPVIDGHNAMEYSDSLYNSISKGSAYYIPKIKKGNRGFFRHRCQYDPAHGRWYYRRTDRAVVYEGGRSGECESKID